LQLAQLSFGDVAVLAGGVDEERVAGIADERR
jgi:hypothetical protein